MNTSFLKVPFIGVFVAVFAASVGLAHAYVVPGRTDLNIYTDSSGNTTVNRAGTNITNNANGTTSVDYGSRTITTRTDGSVQLNDANGRIITIRNNQDLDAYASTVVQETPAITNIEIKNNRIEVAYRQPARFLGIFGGSLAGTVSVVNGGTVEINLPWYRFLFSKNTASVKSAVVAQLQTGVNNGTLNLDSIGTGTEKNITITAGNSARVITIVSSTVSAQVSVSSPAVTPLPATRTATPGARTVAPVARTATPLPQPGTTIASFVGSWNGRFAPNSVSAAVGCPGGSVSFNVKSDGSFQGPVNIDNLGTAFYGGGSVNNAGSMSGGWSLSGSGSVMQGTINLSGKLLASGTGSGTWNVPGGCSGSYSVNR